MVVELQKAHELYFRRGPKQDWLQEAFPQLVKNALRLGTRRTIQMDKMPPGPISIQMYENGIAQAFKLPQNRDIPQKITRELNDIVSQIPHLVGRATIPPTEIEQIDRSIVRHTRIRNLITAWKNELPLTKPPDQLKNPSVLVSAVQENLHITLTPDTAKLFIEEQSNSLVQRLNGVQSSVFYLLAQSFSIKEIADLYRIPFIDVKLEVARLIDTLTDSETEKKLVYNRYPFLPQDTQITTRDFPTQIPHEFILTELIKGTPIKKIESDHRFQHQEFAAHLVGILRKLTQLHLTPQEIRANFPQLLNGDLLRIPQMVLDQPEIFPASFVRMLTAMHVGEQLQKSDKDLAGSTLKKTLREVEGIDDVTLFVRYPPLMPSYYNNDINMQTLMSPFQEQLVTALLRGMSLTEVKDIARKKRMYENNFTEQMHLIIERYVNHGRLHELSAVKEQLGIADLLPVYEKAQQQLDMLLSNNPPASPSQIYATFHAQAAFSQLHISELSCARWILQWHKTH